jgi:cytochrome bd-type quinol oxidase subunit 2
MAYWYYESGGKEHGPVDDVKMRELMRSGVIRPMTQVRALGEERRQKAVECGIFTNGFTPSRWYLSRVSILCGIASLLGSPLYFLSFSNRRLVTVAILGLTGLVLGSLALRFKKKNDMEDYERITALAGVVTSLAALALLAVLAAVKTVSKT